jgi:8-oxo-dGTP pyrophosphatase MutT (NUDIX family)
LVVDPNATHILLIEKNRPTWQAGLFNGIGGKLEEGETAVEAMARECLEETGLAIAADDWQPLGRLVFSGGSVAIFHAQADLSLAQTLTDESVHVLDIAAVVRGDYPLVADVDQAVAAMIKARTTIRREPGRLP